MEGNFLHHVAGVALPISMLLLAGGAIARGVLWAEAGDEQLRRTARRAVEPLCMAALVAAGVDLMAIIIAGSPSVGALVAPVMVVAIACLIGGAAKPILRARRNDEAARRTPAAEPETAPTRPAPPATAKGASLWLDSPAPPPADRPGLWSRP